MKWKSQIYLLHFLLFFAKLLIPASQRYQLNLSFGDNMVLVYCILKYIQSSSLFLKTTHMPGGKIIDCGPVGPLIMDLSPCWEGLSPSHFKGPERVICRLEPLHCQWTQVQDIAKSLKVAKGCSLIFLHKNIMI